MAGETYETDEGFRSKEEAEAAAQFEAAEQPTDDNLQNEGEQLDLESAENRADVVRQFAIKEVAERTAVAENRLDTVLAAAGSFSRSPEQKAIVRESSARLDKTVDDIRSGKRLVEPSTEDYKIAAAKVDNIYNLLSNEKRGPVRALLNGIVRGAIERNAAIKASKRRNTIEQGRASTEQG